MTDDNRGLVAAGAALVWRRQRILWWVFAVNLVLGILGAAGARAQLDRVLQHSLAGNGLAKGFDYGMFKELLYQPTVNLMRSAGSSYLFAAFFPLFLIFVSGGILAVYREDRKFSAEEFFAASGAFFWRFVRLVLFSLIPFGILGFGLVGMNKLSDYLGERAVSALTGFYIFLTGVILITLLVLFVRLWFDIAQVRAVVQNEYSMWRNLWKALGITRRNVTTLFRVYLCISGVAWVTLAAGLFLWTKLPPTATPVTFLLLEFIILMQLLARLWQRASSVTWYARHAAMFPADAVDYTTPAPAELVESTKVVPEQATASEPQSAPFADRPEVRKEQE